MPEDGKRSKSDQEKDAYELRILNLLLPTVLGSPPTAVTKGESPDFGITTPFGEVFVEIVDAIPHGVSDTDTMNVAERRRRSREDIYRVDPDQFGRVIVREIEAKKKKATEWLRAKRWLERRLLLFVNGGQAPMYIRDSFRDENVLNRLAAIAAIDPFVAVVLGDESGAFIWTADPLPDAQRLPELG